MAGTSIDADQFAKLMNTGELHNRLIRDVASLEMSLDAVITYYFTTFKRWTPFTELILERLTVSAKVSIVERIPYERRYPSLRHMKTLKDIIQARNFVAHTHYLLPGDPEIRNKSWLYLFSDYPTVYRAHMKSVRGMFRHLFRTRDIAYHNPSFRGCRNLTAAKID